MSSHARALLDELFLDIFTCLVHDHTTLLACARVCWAWRRELAPTIFETITLKPADDGSLAALASFVHTAVFKLSYSPAQGALLARLPRVRAARVEGVTFDAFADLQLLATGAGARLRSLDVARCTFRAAPPWNANWHAPPWRNYVQRAHPALDSLRVELCEERAPLHYLVYASPSLHTLRCLAVSASRDYLHHIVLLAQHPECRLEVLDLTVVGLDAPLEGEGSTFHVLACLRQPADMVSQISSSTAHCYHRWPCAQAPPLGTHSSSQPLPPASFRAFCGSRPSWSCPLQQSSIGTARSSCPRLGSVMMTTGSRAASLAWTCST
jgi:hypothetical protein